jgi:hypothetical protein
MPSGNFLNTCCGMICCIPLPCIEMLHHQGEMPQKRADCEGDTTAASSNGVDRKKEIKTTKAAS